MEEDEDEEVEDGGSVLKIVIAAVVALLLCVALGGYFLRGLVTEYIPGAGAVYEMIGLSGSGLGDGLAIREVKRNRESVGGKDVLVVRGVIANISDKERPVPMIKLSLYDLDGKVVQSAETAPLKNNLKAAEQIGFKVQLKDPSPLARRLEVTFAPRPTKAKE